jgi:hypothetical protein
MDNTTTAPETIPASELFTALTGEPQASPGGPETEYPIDNYTIDPPAYVGVKATHATHAASPARPVFDGAAVERAAQADAAAEKRTRNTGRRIWQREIVDGDWRDVRPCPPLADLADAMKWLEVELRDGRLKPGNYRPASVQDVVSAVVETVTSVRLT